MADLYTSYETSLALRDAGAPQMDGEKYWGAYIGGGNRLRNDPAYTGSDNDRAQYARAFRADEIIEALGDRLASMYHDLVDEPWFAVIDDIPVPIHFQGDPLAEALAQAWLAVLRGAK